MWSRVAQGIARILQVALLTGVLAGALAALLPAMPALAQCAATDTDQTCTNPAGTTISPDGIVDNNNANITNFGNILNTNGFDGINASNNLTVSNFGLISGRVGLNAGGDVNLTNSGTITGSLYGVLANNNANVTNTGVIQGVTAGVVGLNLLNLVNSGVISAGDSGSAVAGNTVTVVNSGTLSGARGVFAINGGSTLINSGTIVGIGGAAVDFSLAGGNSLTFLPGSRVIGDVLLGTGDTVTFVSGRDVAKLITFGCICGGGLVDTGSTVNVTGGAPYVVSGNQVAILDPTAFGMADRALTDFTGNISSMIGDRFGAAFTTGGGSSAFAPVASPVASLANDAFGSLSPLAYTGSSGLNGMANTTAVDRESGTAAWSKAFVGARKQEAEGAMLPASSIAYGAAIGIDRKVAPNLMLGGFLGGGTGKMNVDLNSQRVDSDYVFGGLYGRLERAAHFFDFAVTAGHSNNSSTRSVQNNLAPNEIDSATASYTGWFVSPELKYGVHMPLGGGNVLTPSAQVRYVAGFFDGYTEAGSAQSLTVGSRTVQNIEERFELALSRTDAASQGFTKTTVKLGILGLERLGDTTINTVLIGQNLSFAAPGDANAVGVYTGFGIDYRITPRVGVFAAAEGTIMSDNSMMGTARGGVRVAF